MNDLVLGLMPLWLVLAVALAVAVVRVVWKLGSLLDAHAWDTGKLRPRKPKR